MYDDNEQGFLSEPSRIGPLIRTKRKRLAYSIEKLADEFSMTVREWQLLEQGRLRVEYSKLTDILELLKTPQREVFSATKNDFFPFILAMGEDPANLTGAEADDLYELYLEVLNFRRKREGL